MSHRESSTSPNTSKLEEIERIIKIEMDGIYKCNEEYEKINSYLKDKQKAMNAINDNAVEDSAPEDTETGSQISWGPNAANAHKSSFFEGKNALKKTLKPINQTLLLMGGDSSRIV